jgi:hypothetical protein
MTASFSVYATTYHENKYVEAEPDEIGQVTMEFDENPPEYSCANGCGSTGTRYPDGIQDDNGDEECPDSECEACEGIGTLWEHGTDVNEEGSDCKVCKSTGHAGHKWERNALTWCNSAAIIPDEDEDSITVRISVGDPRGAFAMQIRRIPEDADEHAGKLVMHLPYPTEPAPHMNLTHVHFGTYVID